MCMCMLKLSLPTNKLLIYPIWAISTIICMIMIKIHNKLSPIVCLMATHGAMKLSLFQLLVNKRCLWKRPDEPRKVPLIFLPIQAQLEIAFQFWGSVATWASTLWRHANEPDAFHQNLMFFSTTTQRVWNYQHILTWGRVTLTLWGVNQTLWGSPWPCMGLPRPCVVSSQPCWVLSGVWVTPPGFKWPPMVSRLTPTRSGSPLTGSG